VRARLPALEKLSLKLQRPRSYRRANLPPVELVEPDHLRELFRAPPPRLATLELIDALPGDEVVAALVGSPLLAQLRVLRLWNADLTDAAARYLTREACGHLELLDLTDPLLDGALAARLSTACDDVRTTNPVLDHVLGRATSKP
jgi:hypothetical protein